MDVNNGLTCKSAERYIYILPNEYNDKVITMISHSLDRGKIQKMRNRCSPLRDSLSDLFGLSPSKLPLKLKSDLEIH